MADAKPKRKPMSPQDRLASDPATMQLYLLIQSMRRFTDRVRRFRQAHIACRTTGRNRCLLCEHMGEDWDGSDWFDLLASAHSSVKLAADLINGDRPRTGTVAAALPGCCGR